MVSHEDVCTGDARAPVLGLLCLLSYPLLILLQFSSSLSSESLSLTQNQKLCLSFEFPSAFFPSQCWDFSNLELCSSTTCIVSWCLLTHLKGLYKSSSLCTPAHCKIYWHVLLSRIPLSHCIGLDLNPSHWPSLLSWLTVTTRRDSSQLPWLWKTHTLFSYALWCSGHESSQSARWLYNVATPSCSFICYPISIPTAATQSGPQSYSRRT